MYLFAFKWWESVRRRPSEKSWKSNWYFSQVFCLTFNSNSIRLQKSVPNYNNEVMKNYWSKNYVKYCFYYEQTLVILMHNGWNRCLLTNFQKINLQSCAHGFLIIKSRHELMSLHNGPIKVNLQFSISFLGFSFLGLNTNIYSGFKPEIQFIFQFHF